MFKNSFATSRLRAVRPLLTLCLLVASLFGLSFRFFDDSQAHAGGRELTTGGDGEGQASKRALNDALAKYRLPVAPLLWQQPGNSTLEEIKLTASDGEASDSAGWTVAISGTTAVVSTLENKVHIFVRRGVSWQLQQTLTLIPAWTNRATASVAIDGGTIIIGFTGKVYVYVRRGLEWTLQHTFNPPAAATGLFGTAVAITAQAQVTIAARSFSPTGAARHGLPCRNSRLTTTSLVEAIAIRFLLMGTLMGAVTDSASRSPSRATRLL
jgi:hypothetical protein